jgi:tetratricopeptide (TPR) repeat protein
MYDQETDSIRGNCIGPEHLRQHLRFRTDGSYVYVNNAKAACSTIKLDLWHRAYARGEVHEKPSGNRVHLRDLSLWGPINDTVIDTAFIFTFVRNPFARVLSSYLDKVALRSTGTCRPPGRLLRQKFGLSPTADLTFRDFLRLINRLPSAEDDLHWRPQVDNVFFNRIRLDYIGKVESYDQDIANVFSRLFDDAKWTSPGWTPHATHAQDKLLEMYGAVETQLVLHKYARDFAAFNYSCDPSDVVNSPVQRSSQSDPLFKAMLAAEHRRSCGQIQAAIDVLQPEAERNLVDPDAAQFLGDLYKTLGSYNQAALWFDRAVDLAAGRPGVLMKAVSLHKRLRNREAAAKIAAIGRKEFPSNSDLRQQAQRIGDTSIFERTDDDDMSARAREPRTGIQALRQKVKSGLNLAPGTLRNSPRKS